MTRVRAKRLGWDGKLDLQKEEWPDPYDYPPEEETVEGELVKIPVRSDLVPPYTNYIVDGQVVDPDTVEEISNG